MGYACPRVPRRIRLFSLLEREKKTLTWSLFGYISYIYRVGTGHICSGGVCDALVGGGLFQKKQTARPSTFRSPSKDPELARVAFLF